MQSNFEWDEKKENDNKIKHGISFFQAQKAFLDPNRLIAEDLDHSMDEQRYYCFSMVEGGVMTVRFTYRANKI